MLPRSPSGAGEAPGPQAVGGGGREPLADALLIGRGGASGHALSADPLALGRSELLRRVRGVRRHADLQTEGSGAFPSACAPSRSRASAELKVAVGAQCTPIS